MRVFPSYNMDCKFVRKFHLDGTPYKWLIVLMYVNDNVEVDRWKIIRDVFGKKCTKDNYHDIWRGWWSNEFSQMHYRKILDYNPISKKWYVGDRGFEIMSEL